LATTSVIDFIFILLVVFQIKHFVADYPLQRPYMLRKFSPGWDFVVPLTVHCGVHALMTLIICLLVAPALWWLAILDFVVHFTMDRIKSGPRYLGRFKDPNTTSYWTSFGLDQMVHHLTHIYIIWVITQHNFPSAF
jgi:hypothetical protein